MKDYTMMTHYTLVARVVQDFRTNNKQLPPDLVYLLKEYYKGKEYILSQRTMKLVKQGEFRFHMCECGGLCEADPKPTH